MGPVGRVGFGRPGPVGRLAIGPVGSVGRGPPGPVGSVITGSVGRPPGTVSLLVSKVVNDKTVVNGMFGVVKTPPAVPVVKTGGRVGVTGAQKLFVNVWREEMVLV